MNLLKYLDPRISVFPGLALAITLGIVSGKMGHENSIVVTVMVSFLCLAWWIFEPIPIPVTSLLPIIILPMGGVLSAKQVAESVGSPLILLLLGGFLLSRGMESSGAHLRLAVSVIKAVGSDRPRRLVWGFMVSGAILSMWISNTASALMLLPIALAVLNSCDDQNSLAMPLLLGLAWSCSIGGIGTPIGTPPNLIFLEVYNEAANQTVTFSQWMMWGLPVIVILLPLAWLWLTRSMPTNMAVRMPSVGPWRSAERRVLVIFTLTALAWVTRSDPFGGWQQWLELPFANDASIALISVVLLFIIKDNEGCSLITWEQASEIPWGVLLLFAGGICLAKGFVVSGLSDRVGDALIQVAVLPTWLMILVIALAVTFLTEATSNTATTALLMPILASVALATDMNPLMLMLPAVMSASCAFMLPVATAPNAVVFGSGRIGVRGMIKEGFVLNLAGALVITIVTTLIVWL